MEFFNFSTNIRVRLITNFLDSTIVSSAMPFMALYFSDEINKATAGIILTVGIFLRLFFGFFGGYFTDRLGRKKQLLFGQFIYILSMSLIAIFIMPSINFAWGIAFVFFISSISNAVRHPALEAMIIDDTNEGNRKKVYLYSAWSYNLSLALGTVIGGLFYLKYK